VVCLPFASLPVLSRTVGKMKTRRQTPKQIESLDPVKVTETPPDSQDGEATPEFFAGVFDIRAKRISEVRTSFVHRQGDSDLNPKETYNTWRRFVEQWRNLAMDNLKDCPTLPDIPAFIGDDYFGGMIHLEDFCRNCAAILRGKAETTPKTDNKTRHSIDFRSVNWFGTDYNFTPNQAAAVKLLWEARENGTPDIGGDTLATQVESDSRRPRDIFKKHSAVGNMICQGQTKGTFRLVEPDKK